MFFALVPQFILNCSNWFVSNTMLHALRMNFENFGHTTKNKIFRLVKLLADLSTTLNYFEYVDRMIRSATFQMLWQTNKRRIRSSVIAVQEKQSKFQHFFSFEVVFLRIHNLFVWSYELIIFSITLNKTLTQGSKILLCSSQNN